MADTTVKWISSSMAGAPVLSGTAGAMVAVLNAALVDGFALNTVDSIVIAGGVATVNRAAGHPFDVGSVALISGATTTTGSVNGEQRVLSIAATSYTFDAAGIGNQTATGTISHKVAPLGLARPFTGSTTLQVYRSPDVSGTRMFLRVDDSGTTVARVVGYESMTTDSAGTGPFPTAAQVSGGAFWGKSDAASASARPWAIVGDDRGFAFYQGYNAVASAGSATFYFGDIASVKSPDPWACLLTGDSVTPINTASAGDASYSSAAAGKAWVARGWTGLGGGVAAAKLAVAPFNRDGQYSGANGMAFPNGPDNGVYLCPMGLSDGGSYRGVMPGVYHCPQNVGAAVFSLGAPITGLSGRTLRVLAGVVGPAFADVTGPWR